MRFAAIVVAISSLSFPAGRTWAQSEETYTTCAGPSWGVFTKIVHPRLGSVWKDPRGVIWSTYQGQFPMAPNGENTPTAIDVCNKLGATLPTIEDYRHLAWYFHPDSDIHQCNVDFKYLFPGPSGYYWASDSEDVACKNVFIWSDMGNSFASFHESNALCAYDGIIQDDPYAAKVRCVIHPSVGKLDVE
jgi:hypothetical protein